MKLSNLLVILSLISFLSIIFVTDSPFKSYTNFFENDNHISLKTPPIYAQDNDGDFTDGNIFPGVKDDRGIEAAGNERINENTNDFSPLSSDSSTNTDDKSNPDDEADQSVDQQSEQQTIGNEVNQTAQQQTIIIK